MTANFQAALETLKAGGMIVVVDDYDRENEGDLVISAEKATPEVLAQLINRARGGLMCIPCEGSVLDRLQIPPMVANSTDKQGTPFTVSVDAIGEGMTTGMPVTERCITISRFIDESYGPESLGRPGHMFPLRAKPGLLDERRGHTEASVVLMKLAGLKPVAVIVEIMNEDGSMTRGQQLIDFAEQFDLQIISVGEIADAYKSQQLSSLADSIHQSLEDNLKGYIGGSSPSV